MNVAHKTEKINKLGSATEEENRIYITHITIHESIFMLLLKLFVIEVAAAVAVIIFHIILFSTNAPERYSGIFSVYMIPIYVVLVILKTALTVFIIIQWFEETYDITSKEVIHRKGFLFRDEARFTLKHIGTIKVHQGFLGRIFNYGTLSLYDWVNGKNIDLYLIHDPLKYHKILQGILPEADKEREVFREHITDQDSD